MGRHFTHIQVIIDFLTPYACISRFSDAEGEAPGLYDLEEARLGDPLVILEAIWQPTSCVAYPSHCLTQFLKQA